MYSYTYKYRDGEQMSIDQILQVESYKYCPKIQFQFEKHQLLAAPSIKQVKSRLCLWHTKKWLETLSTQECPSNPQLREGIMVVL